jgi:hypothetical protein
VKRRRVPGLMLPVFIPDKYTNAHLRLIRSVPCPVCKVGAGRKCIAQGDGHPLGYLQYEVHGARHIARKGWKRTRVEVTA